MYYVFVYLQAQEFEFVIFVCCLQGLFTGTLILLTTKGRNSRILVFSEELFFIYVLPPIIFNAGYVIMIESSVLFVVAVGSYTLISKHINITLFV